MLTQDKLVFELSSSSWLAFDSASTLQNLSILHPYSIAGSGKNLSTLQSDQQFTCAKFLGNGVAILNFHLDGFDLDTADLGKMLQPFAAAFFPKEAKILLLCQGIVFILAQSGHEEKYRVLWNN